MLCSHNKRFIYLKTQKTAGTSIEIFFQRFCLPDGRFVESHSVEETITEAGIVGSRLEGRKNTDNFYNHMNAEDVKRKLGAEVFESYFKFCVVRNPYDKMVSKFWWQLGLSDDGKREVAKLPFRDIKTAFKQYILSMAGNLCNDRQVYTIDNELVVNAAIRFEKLIEDTSAVCEKLKINFDHNQVGSYKSGHRVRGEHWSEYYDEDLVTLVEREYSFELKEFSYKFL
jgi:hypothetical protein